MFNIRKLIFSELNQATGAWRHKPRDWPFFENPETYIEASLFSKKGQLSFDIQLGLLRLNMKARKSFSRSVSTVFKNLRLWPWFDSFKMSKLMFVHRQNTRNFSQNYRTFPAKDDEKIVANKWNRMWSNLVLQCVGHF